MFEFITNKEETYMITQAGLLILGLGVAIPSTLVVLITIITKCVAGNNYEIKLNQLAISYVAALIGWFITFGIRL